MNPTMKSTLASLSLALMILVAPFALAKDDCASFKWDMTRERALFIGEATPAVAGNNADEAPTIATDRLYQLALAPQEQVRYPAASSKKMLADGAYGGLVRFRVEQAGAYRVALGSGFWIDVANAGKTIPSIDFGGSPGCSTPRKVVIYDLPAKQDLVLQFSGATEEQVRVTLTAVSKPAK